MTKENMELTKKILVNSYDADIELLADMTEDMLDDLLYRREMEEHSKCQQSFYDDVDDEIKRRTDDMKMTCNLIPIETSIDAVIQKLQTLKEAGYTRISQKVIEKYTSGVGDGYKFIETEIKEN